MGKFYFYFGTMGAGKTSLAINKAYEFSDKHKNVHVFLPDDVWKPRLESRNGSSYKVDNTILGNDHLTMISDGSVIIVDEAQFLPKKTVLILKKLSVYNNCLVFCFGLLTDFCKRLFEGTKAIIENADTFREIPCMCDFCEKKAQYNFRISTEKDLVVIDKDKYRSLCSVCYDKATRGDVGIVE